MANKMHISSKNVNSSKRKKRPKITPEEKERREHVSEIRNIFGKAGFARLKEVGDKEFTFKGRTGDIDDVFLYKNIIVLLEYTCTKKVSDHLLKKKVIFDHIIDNQEDFVVYFENTFPTFKADRDSYTNSELV